MLIAVLTTCGTASFASCSSNEDNATEQRNISGISDKVWAFSQTHPDGFTIDIRTMTEPMEGIAVSYAATLNCHSRDQLDKVVSHALQHEGYVGGWYNSEDGLYYFDSTKLFPENDLKGALLFGKENGQYSVFILSTYTDIPIDGKVAEILDRGTILLRRFWIEALSSLVLLVTTDHYHSANPMELIGASVLRWPTRLRKGWV